MARPPISIHVHQLQIFVLAVGLVGSAFAVQDPALDPLAIAFEAKVRPVLVNRCEECHADDADGGLRLDTRENLMKGGDSGPAIVIGNANASLMIQAIRQTHVKLKMPKKRAKLPDDEIEALAQWVDSGAYWPDEKPKGPAQGLHSVAEQRSFWSLQPLANPGACGLCGGGVVAIMPIAMFAWIAVGMAVRRGALRRRR